MKKTENPAKEFENEIKLIQYLILFQFKQKEKILNQTDVFQIENLQVTIQFETLEVPDKNDHESPEENSN